MAGLTSNTLSILGGATLGAIGLYLLDSKQGEARRRHLVESASDAFGSTSDAVRSTLNESSQAARGVAADVSDYVQHLAGHLSDQAADASSQVSTSAGTARSKLNDLLHSIAGHAKGFAAQAAQHGKARGRDLSDRANSMYVNAKKSAMDRAGVTESHPLATAGELTGGTIGVLLLGAGAMYFLDPDRGRGRRAWVEDKFFSWVNRTGKRAGSYGRHLSNKAHGAVAEAKAAVPEEWSKAAERAAEAASSAVQNGANKIAGGQ